MGRKTAEGKFEVDSSELVFKFDNPRAAHHFKVWLCEAGEQDYWGWMEYREEDEAGDITGREFDYWKGNTIEVKCGRQTPDIEKPEADEG